MFWTRADLMIIALIKVLFVTALMITLSAGPAGAASAKPKESSDHEGGDHKAPEETISPIDPHLVFMPALVVPVTERGKLLFYYYVGIQLHVEKLSKVPSVKEQVPIIQDAFVRYVHKHPVAGHNGDGQVDQSALISELMPFVTGIIGPDLVDELIIEDIVRSVI